MQNAKCKNSVRLPMVRRSIRTTGIYESKEYSMKEGFVLLCIILVLLLAGCGKASSDTQSASDGSTAYTLRVPPEDRNQAFARRYFAETADGCSLAGRSKPQRELCL